MAGALARNVVIAVVPAGARIGKKAKAFPLPVFGPSWYRSPA